METHPVFLDGHISEVHKHVVQLTGAWGVLHCAEPAEAQLVPYRKTRDKRHSYTAYSMINLF